MTPGGKNNSESSAGHSDPNQYIWAGEKSLRWLVTSDRHLFLALRRCILNF